MKTEKLREALKSNDFKLKNYLRNLYKSVFSKKDRQIEESGSDESIFFTEEMKTVIEELDLRSFVKEYPNYKEIMKSNEFQNALRGGIFMYINNGNVEMLEDQFQDNDIYLLDQTDADIVNLKNKIENGIKLRAVKPNANIKSRANKIIDRITHPQDAITHTQNVA